MAIKGRLFGSRIGPNQELADAVAMVGASTYAMAALNTGFSARFKATQALAILAVKLSWSAVTTPGQVTIRIETDSNGKPSGTLYDANAVMTAQVPATGIQTYTFGTPPTTNLTIDAIYHVVVLTTTGGTTQTLRAYMQQAGTTAYPANAMTAANGTTRTNFAEVTNGVPLCSLILTGSVEDSMGMVPYAGTNNHVSLYTNAGAVIVAGLKFVTDVPLSVAGIEFVILKAGTPTANLRIRIYDSGNSLVANSTIVIPNASMLNAVGRRAQAFGFADGAVLSLAAGTYRIVFDGAADTTGSNCWRVPSATPYNAASAPSGLSMTTAPNIDSPSWTDTSDQTPVRLILDDITSAGSGGGGMRMAGHGGLAA